MKHISSIGQCLAALFLSLMSFAACSGDDSLPLESPAADIRFSVDDIDAGSLTKGAPVTSGNIREIYADNIGVVAFNSANGTEYIPAGTLFSPDESNPLWHTEGRYFWPETGNLDFWAWAPLVSSSGNGLNPVFGPDGTSLKFSYSLPLPDIELLSDASAQPDIIFAHSLSDRFSNNGGVSLSFLHPLSSVAFKCGEMSGGVIRSITLRNVAGSGECAFDGTSFVWRTAGDMASFTQAFNTDVSDGTTGASITYDGDPAGMRTFMMIPQTLGETAAIDVVFDDGKDTSVYSYSLSGMVWKPGKRYIYCISIVFDDGISLIEVVEDFDGRIKRDVRIRNNSDGPQYLRMSVVANWVNADGDIVVSCDFGKEGSLSGFNVTSIGGRWTLHTDGFIYYKKAIASGTESRPLFTTYTPAAPVVPGSHLEMTVLVQAVEYDLNQKVAEAAWGVNVPLAGSIE